MRYVDLKRSFVLIGKDQEASLGLDSTWGRRIGGWLSWHDLLEHRRVVLLAEASSGKTEEFRHQAASLVNQDKAAFFVRIEDLADDGAAVVDCLRQAPGHRSAGPLSELWVQTYGNRV